MNRFVHTDTPSPSPSPSHNPYNVAWCATPFALLMFNTSSRQQYRDCMMGMGLGCQYAQICSLTMLRVHPYLVSLSYHPYMPLFLISQDFLFTCLHSFLYTTTYYLCGRGQAPIKINNREKCLLSSWKWCNMHAYQVSCALPLASLKSEEAICSFSNNMWLSWKWYRYAFVPSFISMSATVSKFEEWRVPEAIWCCSNNVVVMETWSCHGNDVTRMHTKFHLHACYRYQVWGEVPEAIWTICI